MDQGFDTTDADRTDTADLLKELERLEAEIADCRAALAECERLRAALSRCRDDLDGALAAHDVTDSRHPSKGGQHTNGRCCAFGNLNPSAVRPIRELVEAIDSALSASGETQGGRR